jgi:hypothetical protein
VDFHVCSSTAAPIAGAAEFPFVETRNEHALRVTNMLRIAPVGQELAGE